MRGGSAFANVDQGGYSGYPSSYSGGFSSGGMGTLDYNPSLAPVGTKTAGDYNPGNVDQDAAALTYLGFAAGTPGGGNGQAADSASGSGAWNPQFQSAVAAFQTSASIGVDGWIGPGTRAALAAAVNLKNANQPSPAPNIVVPIPVTPVGPAPTPPAGTEDNTLLYAGLAVAGVVVAGAAYLLLRKKKR